MARDDNSGGGAAVMIAIPIAIIIGLAIVLFLTITEAARIYGQRAWGKNTQVATFLWAILALFLLALGVGFYLLSDPATQTYGGYLSAWSFLLWAVLIEIVDKHEAQFDPKEEPLSENLDDYLTSFEPAPAASPNGVPVGAPVS